MSVRLAVVVSAAVHVVVITALVVGGSSPIGHAANPRPTPARAVMTVEPRSTDEVMVTLVTLPDSNPSNAPIATPSSAPIPPARPAAIEHRRSRDELRHTPSSVAATADDAQASGASPHPPTSTGTTGIDTGTGTTGIDTGTAGTLRMRGHDLRLSETAMNDFLTRSRPLVEVPISGRLEQRGREHVADDLVTTMTVHEDGHATFVDKSDVDIHFGAPVPADATRTVRILARLVPLIHGKLDVTAIAMRKAGLDPYASRKRKLLDDTREQRVAIGATHRANQLARSAELMQRNLDRLWRTTLDPAARRHALFVLWDECSEAPSHGEAGTRARAIVLGWIRTHLPAGNALAFTDAEIAALDHRRTSAQHFVPY